MGYYSMLNPSTVCTTEEGAKVFNEVSKFCQKLLNTLDTKDGFEDFVKEKIEKSSEVSKILNKGFEKKWFNKDDYGFFFYSLEKIDGENEYEIVPDNDEYFAKHYADPMLANIIAEISLPGHFTILEFAGEDGEKWGYIAGKRTDGTPFVAVISYQTVFEIDGKLAVLEDCGNSIVNLKTREQLNF